MIKLSDRKTTWRVGFFQPPPLGLTCPDKWMNIRQRNHKTKKGRVQSYLVVQKTCFFLVWGFRGTGVYCIKVDLYKDVLCFIQTLEFQNPHELPKNLFALIQQMWVEFNDHQVSNPKTQIIAPPCTHAMCALVDCFLFAISISIINNNNNFLAHIQACCFGLFSDRLPGSTRSNSPTNASKATTWTCIMASTCSRRSNKSCSYPASLSSVSWANRPMLSKIANRIAVLRPCMDRRNEPNNLLGSMMYSICYLIGFAMLNERVSKCIFIRRSNTFST